MTGRDEVVETRCRHSVSYGTAVNDGRPIWPCREAAGKAEVATEGFELVRALELLGHEQARSGRTGGSRRRFVHPDGSVIALHKPHPGNIVKRYVIEDVLQVLEDGGLI